MERFNTFHETSKNGPLSLYHYKEFPLLTDPAPPEENRLDTR